MAAAATPIVHGQVSAPGVVTADEKRDSGTSPHHQAPFAVQVELVISERAPDARPASLLFGALKEPTLRLRKPIPLDLSVEKDEVVLAWAEIDEFGYGSTMGAAADDFGRSLGELYRRLEESKQLGPDLLNVKRILDQYIEVRTK
jgi:hypothetical protein